MADREKVINDLNVAKLILCNPQMPAPEICIRIGQAITSAINLLKEQEPRVLTLEEAFNLQEKTSYPCIFVEVKNRNDVFLAVINDELYGGYHSDDLKVYRPWLGASRVYHKIEYGQTIRFWNLYPTAEQRKEVPWND